MSQVAFLGRSNVGKSSLVNALLKDAAGGSGRGLVRTSKTPGQCIHPALGGRLGGNKGVLMAFSRTLAGCTQTLNLYRLVANTDPLFLVDLPGYGYAKCV